MKQLTLKNLLLAVLIFGTTAFFTGCDATDTNIDEEPFANEAPSLPPAEMFALDVDFFSTIPAAKNNEALTTLEYEHFGVASTTVLGTSVFLGSQMILPATLSALALQTTPVQEGNKWVWRFNSTIYTVTLSAEVDGNLLDWVLTLDGGLFADFVLYTARTDFDSKSGSWSLYYLVEASRTNVLNAEFSFSGEENETGTLTFTVPTGIAVVGGDEVVYANNVDHFEFGWTQASSGATHNITWETTNEGTILSSSYNDGTKACWDQELKNTDCI